MTTTIESDVRAASEEFYSALNSVLNGDASPMLGIWSHSETVTTMHPAGGRDVGWGRVRESWEQLAKIVSRGKIKLDDQFVQIIGDVAYELGVERGQYTLAGQPVTADFRVTNIYRRESGAWKIVHHQTDLSVAIREVLLRVVRSALAKPSPKATKT
jgi:ketosteroid isomerase-like protein